MKKAQQRRERLFKEGKPLIRPCIYSDIRWMWVAAKRAGNDMTPEEFSNKAEPILAQADKIFILEDRNSEFQSGQGPVGVVLANYDGWSLCPHVEWFPWAATRNKLRCTVGFLQAMRYSNDIGSLKVYSTAEYHQWFKKLKRYVAISYAGKVPHGRFDGDEHIFYLRGRKQHEFYKRSIRRERVTKQADNNQHATNISKTSSSDAERSDDNREHIIDKS